MLSRHGGKEPVLLHGLLSPEGFDIGEAEALRDGAAGSSEKVPFLIHGEKIGVFPAFQLPDPGKVRPGIVEQQLCTVKYHHPIVGFRQGGGVVLVIELAGKNILNHGSLPKMCQSMVRF